MNKKSPPNNWGKWGKSDQIGTLNFITSGAIKHAATLVKKGKIISMAMPIGRWEPAADPRVIRLMTESGQGTRGRARPIWIQDWLSLPLHASTHWDGLAHVYGEGAIYNGYGAEENITPKGAQKNGIEHAANKVIGRGVLIDVARQKGVNRLEPGFVIMPDHLEEALSRQNVKICEGDVLLMRTGWVEAWKELGAERFLGSAPGIGWEVSQWLREKRVAAVALDNVKAEVSPCQAGAAARIGFRNFEFPVHCELIRNQGMMIGEMFYLEKLAKACAEQRTYEFLFLGSPLNIPHATAGPLNPLAVM